MSQTPMTIPHNGIAKAGKKKGAPMASTPAISVAQRSQPGIQPPELENRAMSANPRRIPPEPKSTFRLASERTKVTGCATDAALPPSAAATAIPVTRPQLTAKEAAEASPMPQKMLAGSLRSGSALINSRRYASRKTRPATPTIQVSGDDDDRQVAGLDV